MPIGTDKGSVDNAAQNRATTFFHFVQSPKKENKIMADETIKKLIKVACDVRRNAYSRYTNFPVGAALLCDDGTIFSGCNVENASLGLSVCAEQTAIVKAISEGHRKFIAMAVSSALSNDSLISPCGRCRQFLIEFGNYDVYLVRADGSYHKTTVVELLPYGFTPETFQSLNDKK